MTNQLLLLEDVDGLGRKGDLVKVKPGYSRNFLLPKQKAVVADKRTLRLRARLQEERAKQAEIDRKEAEELAKIINDKVLSINVKVDPDGNLYGSVVSQDIVTLFEKEGIAIEKRYVVLPKPIKKTGTQQLSLKLKEGVLATFTLNVVGEGQIVPKEIVAELPEEEKPQEEESLEKQSQEEKTEEEK